MASKGLAKLVLGWCADSDQHPQWWLSPSRKSYTDHDVVGIPADRMERHCLIVAQSGSGKSFFLGRLIEEIALKTSARCLILDPNGDFRRLDVVRETSKWKTAKYDVPNGTGWLPTERARRLFSSKWSRVSKRFYRLGDSTSPAGLWWPSVNIAFMDSEVQKMKSAMLFHCHTLVKGLGTFFWLKYSLGLVPRGVSIFSEMEKLLREDVTQLKKWFRDEYASVLHASALKAKRIYVFNYQDRPVRYEEISHLLKDFRFDLARLRSMIDTDIVNFYLQRVAQFRASRVLSERPPYKLPHGETTPQVAVFDLPSLPNRSTRLLAVNEALTTEWERAKRELASVTDGNERDKRVPTFVVVDEAHQLMPEVDRGDLSLAVKEQFRTIAAEGRKYGLFLIAVTQRPEKLDRFIISECENLAVMHLNSEASAEAVSETLAINSSSLQLHKLKKGRFALFGPWAKQGFIVGYTAGRRTAEGGADLPRDWAYAR